VLRSLDGIPNTRYAYAQPLTELARSKTVVPTALQLTPAELERYVQAACRRARAASPVSSEAAQRGELVEQAREAAALLKGRFRAARVVLFGSLAHGAWSGHDSDVDLAVEDVCGDDYWRAWEEVEAIFGRRSVDLIALETASSSLRAAVDRYGVTL